MTREQIEELAAMDSLGALDGADALAWAGLAEADAEAARLRGEFGRTAATLGLLAPAAEAPAKLHSRVMGAVFGDGMSPAADETGSTRAGWSKWAAAALIAILAAGGAAATTRHRESVVVRDVRGDAGAPFVALAGYGDFSGCKASVLWDSGQRGWWMQASGLPAIPRAYCYRVWAVGAEDGEIYDCGALSLHAGGMARRFLQPGTTISSMRGFVISIEPAGRTAPLPSSPAVMITPELRG